MKYFLSLIVITLLAALPVTSQTGKARQKAKRPSRAIKKANDAPQYDPPPAAPPTVEQWRAQQAARGVPPIRMDDPPPPPVPELRLIVQKPSSEILKETLIGEWGAKSISMPQDLIKTNDSTDKKANGKVAWTAYERSWKLKDAGFLEGLEIDLSIKTWDNEIKEIVPELKLGMATPEVLGLRDLLADVKQRDTPGSMVKEAGVLTVGELTGSYYRAGVPSTANRFMLGWGAYRYYNGKLQSILLTINGGTEELEKARAILRSLRFN